MIKFFRNIRQNLLSEGKTSKYLKYALGEIILVVIGILIALQINTWNEQRKIKNKEILYLKSLHKDLLEMQKNYSYRMQISPKRLKTALNGLQYVQNCGKDSLKKASLDSMLYDHQVLPDFFVIDDTYNEMLSANVLAGLSNKKLKSDITQLFTWINNNNEYIKYFRSDLGRASSIIWKYVNFGYDSLNELSVEYKLEQLCQKVEFKNALVEVVDSREDYSNITYELKLIVDQVTQELEKELVENQIQIE